MKVRNMRSNNGNKIANQFIIEDEENNKQYFQSYNSTIVCIDYKNKVITIGRDYNYSTTTGKYRNKFFSDNYFDKINTLSKLDKALAVGYFEDVYNLCIDRWTVCKDNTL